MENNIEKASITVPDDVFQNPVVQERWSLTVQHITWGLIALAGIALVGTFLLAAFVPTIPDTVILLATTVVTGCISGLVGFIAGKNSNA